MYSQFGIGPLLFISCTCGVHLLPPFVPVICSCPASLVPVVPLLFFFKFFYSSSAFHLRTLRRFRVKVTLRSAASPCRALSGHLTDTHISLGTFQGHSHYSLVTLFVHMGTCNSHMSPSWGTCSATCPVNVRIWTSKCSRGSCYKALGFFFLFHNCFTLLVHLCFSCLAPHTFSFPT